MAIPVETAMAVSSASSVEVGVVVPPVATTTKEEKDEDDGGGGLAVDVGVSSSFPIVASPPSNSTPVRPTDGGVDAEEEGREDEEGGTKDEGGVGSSKQAGGEAEGDDPEVIAIVASSTDGKVGDDNNTVTKGHHATDEDDTQTKRNKHTHEQLREFCSRPDLHPIRFGASNVARMAGLNPFADLPEILMRLVYQSPLGQSLLKRDAELLGLTIRSDEEELIELATKIGGGTLANVKRALAIRRGEELPDTVHSAAVLKGDIRNEAVKSGKLTREEMRVLTEGTRQAVDTGFGTAHEDVGLDLYEAKIGWEVRERNSAVMQWNFVRAEDGDDGCEGPAGRCDEVGDADDGDGPCEEAGGRHRGNGSAGDYSSTSGEANSTPAASNSTAVGSESRGGMGEIGNVTEGAMIHDPLQLPTVVPMGPATRRVRNRKRPRTPPTPTAQSTGGCSRGSAEESSSDADGDAGKTSEDGCDAVRRGGTKRRRCDPSPESGPGGGEGKRDGERDDDCCGPGTSSGSDGDGVERRGKGPPSTEVEEEAAFITGDDSPSSSDGEEATVAGASSSDPQHSSDVGDPSSTIASRPVAAKVRRSGTCRRRRPFFTIMGSVDGIRDELWFDPRRTKHDGPGEEKKESEAATIGRPPSSPSKDGCTSKGANEDEEQAVDDRTEDDGWTLRPVVVECKHRMRSSSSSGAVPPPPPPLYDQVQACCYCLMYGADRADIVEVVRRRPPSRRVSDRSPPENVDDRKHTSSSSSVGQVEVVPAAPSHANDDDGDRTAGHEDDSSGVGVGACGVARPPEEPRRPSSPPTTVTSENPPDTVPELDVDVTVSPVDLDDPLHRHRENWHRVVLPRLRSFVEAVYAVRGDDDRRYRLLAAMCGSTGGGEDGGGSEEEGWKVLLDECDWLADCDTALRRSFV